jgi:hypothetical protein
MSTKAEIYTEDKMEVAGEETEREEIEGEPPTPTTKEGSGDAGEEAASDQLALIGGFFSALVLLVAVLTDDNVTKKYENYGISLAVITMFFALVGFGLSKKPMGKPEIPSYINYFLFLWNFLGACIMTFGDGPFLHTSNGYFAAWGTVIFAVMGLGVPRGAVKEIGPLMGHLASSIIVVVAIASYGFDHDYKGELTYGIIVACFAICTVLILMKIEAEIMAKLKFPILALFAIMWIISACILTFRGPFIQTGNGYCKLIWASASKR